MTALALVVAYGVGRQGRHTEEDAIATAAVDAQSGDRPTPALAPLQPRQIVSAEPVRGHFNTLPSPRGTDADPDPLAALADVEPDEPAAEVGPPLDADDDLMAWAPEPTETSVASDPLLDAEEDLLLATEADDQAPIEVGPVMDADDPDAADTPPDDEAPIEVGPDLDADLEEDPPR